MANQQQGSTAEKLKALRERRRTPEPKAPSAIGVDDLDALYEQGRQSVGTRRTSPTQNTSALQDAGTSFNIGVRQLPGIVTGLADIPAGMAGFDRPFDKLGSAIGRGLGIDNASAIEALRKDLTPATQRAQANVEATEGFFPSIAAYLENPRAIAADVVASVPSTLAGGGLGGVIAKQAGKQAIKQVAKRGRAGRVTGVLASRAGAAGAGEGAVAAGAQMDSIAEDVDPRKAATAAVGTGIATALISGVGARVANKLKIGDPDLVFVGKKPTLAPGVKKRNVLTRMGLGAVSEGVFQEMPQGSFEQLAANWAEDKPLLEGVSEAAVGSLMAGMGMGGVASGLNVGGPQEYIAPTPESDDATSSDSATRRGGNSEPRGRAQVTDKKLVRGVVQMANLLDQATTDEQRKIITQHLREAQAELKNRGIDKSIVDEAASQENFANISQRIDKNIALSKGLAAADVDRANVLRDSVDEDIQRLVMIERVYPGTRARYLDNNFAEKFAAMESLAERVEKNKSPKSRASNASKLKNAEALRAAQLELEMLAEDNPELLDRFEAARASSESDEFNPLDNLNEPILPVDPDEIAIEGATPAESAAEGPEALTPDMIAAAERYVRKGAASETTDQPVGDQPTAEATDQPVDELQTPELSTTPAQRKEAERLVAEDKRREKAPAAQAPTPEDNPVTRSVKQRLEKLMGATQSTAGLGPEPSTVPQRVPDERPPAGRSFAERVTDPVLRRQYIKKNGQLTKRGAKDLELFESMSAEGLLDLQAENLQLAKRGPLVRAQYELIQDILDTTKASELESAIADRPVEPLTPDEMSNIIIDAQNTGDRKKDLTDKQLKYFEMYNQYYVNEGRDDPIAHMRLQLFRENSAAGVTKLPDDKHLRQQVDIAAQKIVEAIRVRRGLGSRREAQRVLGPMFRGLATPSDPNTGFRQMSLLQAYGTGDPDEVRLAKERMRLMAELEQDIVQRGAQNDARGGFDDLSAAEPGEFDPEDYPVMTSGEALDEGFGERGSVSESAPFVAGPRGSKVGMLREMSEVMKLTGATPQQAKRLSELGDMKAGLQDSINDAQDELNSLDEMGENLPMYHASPLFEVAGEAWNKAAARSKENKGVRWAKVRNDPQVLDHWLAVVEGVETEMSRKSNESESEFQKRKNDMLVHSRAAVLKRRADSGGWAGRNKAVTESLAQLQGKLTDVLAAETELLRKLGANIDDRTAGRDSYLTGSPTAPGPAPTINYRRRKRELQPSELPERFTTKNRAKTRIVRPEPVVREPPVAEPSAVTFKGSPFIAGSQRTFNPDVEVAEIFRNPRKAAEEDTFAILVGTDVERFLSRVAAMQAEETQAARKIMGVEPLDLAAEKASRLKALKEVSFTGAKNALDQGKKLTAPTLDHRLGAVKNVDAALAQVAAGSNRVQYVELVTSRQLKRINGQLNRLKSVENSLVGGESVTIPSETKEEAAAPAAQLRGRVGYNLDDHNNQVARGAFRRRNTNLPDWVDSAAQDDPYAVRASLERAAQGDNTPEQQALIEQILSEDIVKPRLSIAQRAVVNPSTTEQVQAAIERYVPQGRRAAVRVVQSLSDIETYLAQHGFEVSAQAGGFTHNGKVFLIAENIEAGTAGGILMHEVGVHLSMKPDEINSLASTIREMAESGDKLARGALNSANEAADTVAGFGGTVTDFDTSHEVVAYFVEDAVNAGIDPTQLRDTPKGVALVLSKIVKLVQSSLRALGLSKRSLTAQDIVDAAYGAADTLFRDPVGDPTVRMSLSNMATDNRNYNKWLDKAPAARHYLTALKHYTQRVGQTFMFSHQFADMAKKAMPAAADYFRLVAKRVTARGKFDADLQIHNNKAKEFSKLEYDQVNDYFIESQKKQAWGFKPHKGAVEPNNLDRDLERMFSALSTGQQAFIKETFAMASQLQTQREEVMRNEVEQSIIEAAMRESDPVKRQRIQLQGVADLAKFDKEYRTRRTAWLPLRRHGEFAAVFVSDELSAAMDQDPTSQEVRDMKGDESHYVVEFHAKITSAAAAEERLLSAATRPGNVRKFERQAMLNSHELIPANFMNAMRSNLEAAPDVTEGVRSKLLQAWTKLYIEQLAETSIRKSELQRMDTAGFDRDMIKNFTQYGSAVGGTIAGIQMGRETHAVLNRLRSDATQPGPNSLSNSAILNELLERHAFMLDPSGTPIQDKVMGWVSLNMLLTSPAYFMVNSTQPFMLTLPVLGGNFGFNKAAARMAKNYKVIAKAWKAEHSFAPNQITKLLSGDLADLEVIRSELGDDTAEMMEELQQLGLFDIGIAADLGAIDNTRFVVTNALGKAHRGATHAVRTVEVFNRGVTALTAYQLAKANPKQIPVGSNGKRPSPREYAIQQVLETQGDYSGHNAPSIINRIKGVGKMMTQFRKFQLIQIGLLVRTMHQSVKGAGPYEKAMAKRQLSYILGMHLIAGGALGLPMANIASMVYALFGDEDEPDDLEVRLRQEIGDKGTADLILKGIPAAWGVDLSAKVGMGQTVSVLPFTNIELTRDNTLAAIGALSFGATGATAAQLADAAGQLSQGNYANAFAGAMPRGIRDVTRAVMYSTEGLRRRNPTRDTAISADEFTSLDIFMQGIGLPTTRTTGMQSRNRFYQNYKQLVGDRSGVIKADFVEAFEANDAQAMQEARNEWNELQEARVRNGFKRQSVALLTRAVRDKRKRERDAVGGVFVDRSDRGFLDLME